MAIGVWKSGKPIELKFRFKTTIAESDKYFKKELTRIIYNHYHPKLRHRHDAIVLE